MGENSTSWEFGELDLPPIAEGRLAICPEISEALAVDRVQEEKTRLHGLSPREFEIFRMILDDAKSTDEIAATQMVLVWVQAAALSTLAQAAALGWAGAAHDVGLDHKVVSTLTKLVRN